MRRKAYNDNGDVMEQIVYGDMLFFINFSMDFLTLFIVGKILRRKMKTLSLLLAASIGALYGVAAVFLQGNTVPALLINISVSVLMCYIVFGRRFVSCTALFYAAGLFLGGAVTAIFGLVNRLRGQTWITVNGSAEALASDIPFGWMAVICLILTVIAIAGGQKWRRRSLSPEVGVEVLFNGRKAVFTALTDSGNLLREPIGGLPVIICVKSIVAGLAGEDYGAVFGDGGVGALSSLDLEHMRKLRIIPAGTAAGEGIAIGLIPDEIKVGGISRSACIAMISQDDERRFGGCEGIIPAELCGI